MALQCVHFSAIKSVPIRYFLLISSFSYLCPSGELAKIMVGPVTFVQQLKTLNILCAYGSSNDVMDILVEVDGSKIRQQISSAFATSLQTKQFMLYGFNKCVKEAPVVTEFISQLKFGEKSFHFKVSRKESVSFSPIYTFFFEFPIRKNDDGFIHVNKAAKSIQLVMPYEDTIIRVTIIAANVDKIRAIE